MLITYLVWLKNIVHLTSSNRNQTCNTVIYTFNICSIRITIRMLHTITKRLEICIDINIEISQVDHYTWIFTSRIFRLALEISFLLKYFFLLMAYELLCRKLNMEGSPNNSGGGEGGYFLKKINTRGDAYQGPESAYVWAQLLYYYQIFC